MEKINLENNSNEETVKKNSNLKYFFGTFIIFLILYSIVVVISYLNTKPVDKAEIKEPISKQFIVIFSDKIEQNLNKNEEKIQINLQEQIDKMNEIIDNEVNTIFDEIINKNLDAYLDFHYSIIGSYTELLTMAFDTNPEKILMEKLLGEDFSINVDKATNNILEQYKKSFMDHQYFIKDIATEGVDTELNSEVLKKIKMDIDSNLTNQTIKTGVIGAALVTKITSIVLAKISAKVVIKTGAKVGTKVAAASSGAAGGAAAGGVGGAMCGPAAIICSPIGAIVGAGVAWFTTDAIVNTVDEKIYRDELKNEIVNALNSEKIDMRNKYVKVFQDEINQISTLTKNKFKDLEIKEKKKIIDKVY